MKHLILFLFCAGFFAAGSFVLYHAHATRHTHELAFVLVLYGASVALAVPARAKQAFGAVAAAYRDIKGSPGGGAP